MENKTREEIRAEIRKTSKDAYVLAEMKRLGFWENNKDQPSVPEQLITKEAALAKELRDLLAKQRVFDNRDKLLKKIRKERMKASREQQKENKLQREANRKARAKAWKKEQEQNIIYLGEGISKGLNKKESDTTRLSDLGLPHFENVWALSEAMQMTIGQIRFLSFNREVSKVNHYQRFKIAKKTGGFRHISAPMPLLKSAQYWILENILYRLSPEPAANGFIPEKSIVTNAVKHVGQRVLINMDLKDFFPTVDFKRVKGLFKKMGYSEQIATIFASICTEAEVTETRMDGERYFIQTSERKLPQGAPTSPMITNLICKRLDKRMEGLVEKFGYVYTRYADDLSFSSSADAAEDNISAIIKYAKSIVEEEGFHWHPDKLHVMRKGSRKEVTGVVVNEKLNVNRKKLRQFRALLHNIEQSGIEGKHWNGITNPNTLWESIWGFANFVKMVNPEKGQPLVDQVKVLHG